MQAAAEALLAAGADGLQLTPGNAPTRGFEAWLEDHRIPSSAHHGFCFDAMRAPVWRADGTCRFRARSVHPPRRGKPGAASFEARMAAGDYTALTLETMYGDYHLGSGAALERAMQAQLALAVDVSHVYLQHEAGVIGASTWAKLRDYEHINEVHVSANDGRTDRHLPIRADTFGLEWARERLAGGALVVLECYMHKLDAETRRRQVDLLRGPA